MEFKVKTFEELTNKELYEILKARQKIFVLEQKIFYLDMDNIDYNSLHIFIEDNGEVVAYLRAFKKKGSSDTMQFGRVLTLKHGNGLGKRLLKYAINTIKEQKNIKKIFMEAQEHAISFYKQFDFQVTSDVFIEDEIPHVCMELEI